MYRQGTILFADRVPPMSVLPAQAGWPRCCGGGPGWRRALVMDMIGPLLLGLELEGLHRPNSSSCECDRGDSGTHCAHSNNAAHPRRETNNGAAVDNNQKVTAKEGGVMPWHAQIDVAGFRPADIRVTSHRGGYSIRAMRVASQREGMLSRAQVTHFVEAPPGVDKRNLRVWWSEGILHLAEKEASGQALEDAEALQNGDIMAADTPRATEQQAVAEKKAPVSLEMASNPEGISIDVKDIEEDSDCCPKDELVEGEDSQTCPDDEELAITLANQTDQSVHVHIIRDDTINESHVDHITIKRNEDTADTDEDVQYVMANENDVATKENIADTDVGSVNDIMTKEVNEDSVAIKEEDTTHDNNVKDNPDTIIIESSSDVTVNSADNVKAVKDTIETLVQSQNAPFRMCMNVAGFDPSDIKVRVVDRQVTVQAERSDVTDGVQAMRRMSRTFTLPSDLDADSVRSALTSDGNMTIFGDRKSDGSHKEKIVNIQRIQ